MLGLESKQVAHLEGVDRPLLAPVRVSDVIDQLDLADLIEMVPRDDLVFSNHSTAIGSPELRLLSHFLADRGADQRLEPRVEQIEDQPTTRHQVPSNRIEAGELFGHGSEMLERTKGKGHQMKEPAELELPHVGPNQLDLRSDLLRLRQQAGSTDLQHRG